METNEIDSRSHQGFARSRSRGRRDPNELLARKQQLVAQTGSGLLDSSSAGDTSHHRRAKSLAAPSNQTSGEDKLESLTSELLRSQQQQQANLADTIDLSNVSSLSAANEAAKKAKHEFSSSAKSIDDVYILLAKKEQDLQLAAELGKALLEKNDQLSKANERITEDYTHKLELLEQDKHKLKRKLDQLDAEYENRLIELQTDCNLLKNQLEEQQQLTKQAEKEKSKLIDDLVQQNQRLTNELVEATKSEELLSSQLEQVNERFNARLSNRQDHVTQLEALKEEIQIVNQRKQDLERRLKVSNADKGRLSVQLEESGDKLLLFEGLLNEKEAKLGELVDELQEHRDSSSWLADELEAMISLNERLAEAAQLAAPQTGSESSGAETLVMLLGAGDRKRAQLVEQLKDLRLKSKSRLRASELIELSRQRRPLGRSPLRDSLRRQQTGSRVVSQRQRSRLLDDLDSRPDKRRGRGSPESNHYEFADSDEDLARAPDIEGPIDLPTEIYLALLNFRSSLQQRKERLLAQAEQRSNQSHLSSPNSNADSGISTHDDLDKTATELTDGGSRDPAVWRQLLASIKSLIEEMPCNTCSLMIGERADYERLQKLHAKLRDELRLQKDQLLELTMINTQQETKMSQLDERCNILAMDLNNCDKPKEEIVKLAWKARDEAVERKNNAEIALAKTRIENMQISSQLMEVVQQKGELSQKLAQFEDDIHYMTLDSVKAKFTWEEYKAETLRSARATQRPATESGIGTNLRPLAQALLTSLSNVTNVATTVATTSPTNGNNKSNVTNSVIGHQQQQPSTNLVRNFTSNKFNLRFWQRNQMSETTKDSSVVSLSQS